MARLYRFVSLWCWKAGHAFVWLGDQFEGKARRALRRKRA